VRINAGRKRLFLGKFTSVQEAARVYDRASYLLCGDMATTK
jgi:hypothetical protein